MTPSEIQEYVDNRIEARLEMLANLAAERALQKVYADIGASVLRKVAWLLGVALIALASWLAGAGKLKP